MEPSPWILLNVYLRIIMSYRFFNVKAPPYSNKNNQLPFKERIG